VLLTAKLGDGGVPLGGGGRGLLIVEAEGVGG